MSGDIFLKAEENVTEVFFILKLFRISLVIRRSEIGISGFSITSF